MRSLAWTVVGVVCCLASIAVADNTTIVTCRDGRQLRAPVPSGGLSQSDIKELCSSPPGSVPNDSASFVYHWEADQTVAGHEYSAYVNSRIEVQLLDEVIRLPDGSSPVKLLQDYNIRLIDSPGAEWTQGHAYQLLQTLKSIPQSRRDPYQEQSLPPSEWMLTWEHVPHDIRVDRFDGRRRVTVSAAAFANAAPRLALVEGKRSRYYSQRLHHALVRFVTVNGTDESAYEKILQERYGLTTHVPDYRALTESTTGGESRRRFQKFHPEEVIRLINMLEEMPSGMHALPELRFLVRRLNGTPHPLHPSAPAVAWPSAGYIEFMESAFRAASDSEIHRLIIHEKAHFLWAHLFDDQLKKDWIAAGGWYRNDSSHSGWSTTKQTEFVSAYAHDVNPNEDMAESIAHFLVNPDKLRSRAPAKYEFIRDRIMQGSVYLSKIRDDLTFRVYNLYPDYVYPGKIRRVDIRVDGTPEEDKQVRIVIELHADDPVLEGASYALTRIHSEIGTYVDTYLYPIDARGRSRRGEPGVILASDRLTISKYAKSGYWAPRNIRTWDMHGNERMEGHEDFGWQLYIDNALEDVTPPEYVNETATLIKSTATRHGQEIQLIHAEWEVKEDTAMGSCYASLNDTIHETYRIAEGWGHWDQERELCTVEFEINEYMPTSVYSLNFIMMEDQAGNSSPWVFVGEEDQVVPQVEIETDSPDLTPPEMDVNRISILATPANPDAPDGETIVTLRYRVFDSGSGYGIGWYYLRDPQGVKHHRYAYRDCEQDDAGWETCTDTVILPRGSAPGIWGLSEVVIEDRAGNNHRYDFTEIVHADVDCEPEEDVSGRRSRGFTTMIVAAITTVPCPPQFEVAH